VLYPLFKGKTNSPAEIDPKQGVTVAFVKTDKVRKTGFFPQAELDWIFERYGAGSSYSADRASPETASSFPAAESVDLTAPGPSSPRTRRQREATLGSRPRGILRNRMMMRIP